MAHLLRRVDELLEDAKRGQAKTLHAVRRLLQQALRPATIATPMN